MAKLAYSKLGLNKLSTKEPKVILFNEQEVEVIQYLPVEKKLDLISDIVNNSIDDNNYYNSCRIEIFLRIKMIEAYTNLTFTDKQKEDYFKLYDQLMCSGFTASVMEAIPDEEYTWIHSNVTRVIKNIYKQRNSALGILESISKDYSNLQFDATEIQKNLADPDNLTLLKDVLSKLG